ncbi:HAMP domain-containing sensor histidine kinase [Psychrobacter arenosus]|uniref:sensor histidine kinase n=1 Tax=Psychrobacter arenosus TaxID=256326 RepID=UPI001917B22C|nr:ATP-binding protein [Psychrobacter arenosus]
MIKARPVFKSLQFQLIFWSLLPLLLLAVAAGGYGFWYNYNEVNDFQDDNLKSVAKVLVQTLEAQAEGQAASADVSRDRHFNTDDDDGDISVDIIALTGVAQEQVSTVRDEATNHPDKSDKQDKHNKKKEEAEITLASLATIPKGISTQRIDDHTWRVYRLNSLDVNDDIDRAIIVRQRTEFRDDLAQSSAWQSFLPLTLAMVLLTLLLPFIMWRMFKPVRQLHQEINARQESDLAPLASDNLPTELLPLVASLNRLLALAKTHIERQQRFIADAAHELRSPLTATSLQLQRLQRLPHDETMAAGLDKLALRLKRNQQLVEQLLTLARAGNVNSVNEPVDIRPITEQAVGLLVPIADHQQIDLSVELQTDGQVNADATSLLLLIKNLLQNAIVYTPAGGQVAVKLWRLAEGQRVHDAAFGTQVIATHQSRQQSHQQRPVTPSRLILQVMDSGPGIEPTDYERVFEPFVRLSQRSQATDTPMTDMTVTARSDSAVKTTAIDGTGLGLSIVKSICEQAGIAVFLSWSPLVNEPSIDEPAINDPAISQTGHSAQQGLCVTLVF